MLIGGARWPSFRCWPGWSSLPILGGENRPGASGIRSGRWRPSSRECPSALAIRGTRRDAWSEYRDEPIGAVFLLAEPDGKTVRAYNTTCPHAGCAVGYLAGRHCFACPCHNSEFELNGEPLTKVPPRGMDTLDCEIRGDGEIWVRYQDFVTGTESKTPKA